MFSESGHQPKKAGQASSDWHTEEKHSMHMASMARNSCFQLYIMLKLGVALPYNIYRSRERIYDPSKRTWEVIVGSKNKILNAMKDP